MSMTRQFCTRSVVFAAAVAASMAVARGDSLVTVTGHVYVGTFTKTATGYVVKAPNTDPVEFAAADVKRVLLDHADPSRTSITGITTPVSIKGDPRALKILLNQGTVAYDKGAFDDARDAFTDALTVDPANAAAGRGLGFSYLRLKSPFKAVKPLDIAAGKTPVLDRPLTIAISSTSVTSHNPMRAVKYIKTYLEAHPSPQDEPMLNAFGSALSQVEGLPARSDLFKDATKLYQKLNAELETTQPGKKRWGITWLDAADVDSKMADSQKAQKDADAAVSKLQGINNRLASLKEERSNVGLTPGSVVARNSKAAALDREISELQDDQSKAQADSDQANEAWSHVSKQDFPSTIETEDVELPLTISTSAVVVATNTETAPPKITAVTPGRTVTTPGSVAAKPHTSNDTPPVTGTDDTSTTPTTPTPAAPPAPPVDQHITRYSVAFAVAPNLVVTAANVVADASDIHVENSTGVPMQAEVARTDRGLGLALLRVKEAHFSCLALAPAMTHGAISAWGFPTVSMFNPVPQEMNCGASTPAAAPLTIRFQASPRLPGGPLLQGGSLIGVELTARDTDPTAVPAVSLADLKKFLADDANPGTPASDVKATIVQVVAEQ